METKTKKTTTNLPYKKHMQELLKQQKETIKLLAIYKKNLDKKLGYI